CGNCDRRPDQRNRARCRGRAGRGADARRAAAGDALRNLRTRARRPLRRLPGAGRPALRARRLDGRVPSRDRRDAGSRPRTRAAQMSAHARLGVFAAGALGLTALLAWGFAGLPAFGGFHGAYGTLLPHTAPSERHTANVVAAVVVDYRGFDTIGEELILFCAVMGVALLLRDVRDE